MDELAVYLTSRLDQFPEDLTRRELAYARIKDAIQNAKLQPGDPLTEIRLSRLLGISRTPVREALQQLVQEGLAESTPGHAVTVATRTVQDLLDVIHIRSLLEPEQVRLAAEAIHPDQSEALEGVMRRLEAAAEQHDLHSWVTTDVTFHELLKDACPNQLLGETVVQLKTRVHHMANIDTHTDPERLMACTREHRAVVDAVRARDGAAAKTAMEAHISALTNSLLKRISYR
jgi:DNA-binding GntR family transcriptional regulator